MLRTFRSASLKRDWSYTVYLPPGYNPEGARYPVMYLLHGNAGNANDWVTQGRLQATADTLIERREIPPVVIVMPQGGTDWYVDRKEKMQSAFLNDLLPEVEAHFAVSNQRAGRAIGGVSMGGFGALRSRCSNPGCSAARCCWPRNLRERAAAQFRRALRRRVRRPAVRPARVARANYPALMRGYFARSWRIPMFIAVGDDDLTIQTESSVLYTQLRRAQNPAELRIVDGGHTWDVWRGLLGQGLKYALECVK